MGPEPTLKQKWRTLGVVEMVLKEGEGRKRDISAVQNLLIKVITGGVGEEGEEVIGGKRVTGEKVKKRAEKLRQLNYKK
jgi:hypothetical protein